MKTRYLLAALLPIMVLVGLLGLRAAQAHRHDNDAQVLQLAQLSVESGSGLAEPECEFTGNTCSPAIEAGLEAELDALFAVPANSEDCFDGVDNDGNGITDAADPACAAALCWAHADRAACQSDPLCAWSGGDDTGSCSELDRS